MKINVHGHENKYENSPATSDQILNANKHQFKHIKNMILHLNFQKIHTDLRQKFPQSGTNLML